MQFIFEPAISVKIKKMKERVRWRHQSIIQRGIDQTTMVLDDGKQDSSEFSFMVIGDSGTRSEYKQNPQRRVAELMLPHREQSSFVLHTGDVVYTVGSHEYYPRNFIEPYREFIVGAEHPRRLPYDRMIFKTPILPVLGNHDYYDVPWMYRLLAGSTLPLRRLFRYKDIEVGWHGSYQGNAYARAFMDYLQALNPEQLKLHLDEHYTAKTDTGRCLRYQPGVFTRLPNRYYTFRYGGIDFFALDSNTFNAPSPLPDTPQGQAYRRELEERKRQIEEEEFSIMDTCNRLNPNVPEEAEQLDALKGQLYQIDEVKIDIEKQLKSDETTTVDFEQLDWLQTRLIQSWHEGVRGRIVYFHHPPYVTEASKWQQAQTLAVRHRIRAALDNVAKSLGDKTQGRPIVDLVFSGHAHCLEYLRTTDTGYGDSHINWIISGGSGRRPRRQREEGNELMETFPEIAESPNRKVADCFLFVGRSGYDTEKRLPYSFVRVDVKQAETGAKFIITPFVTERFQGQWSDRQLESFVI
jgi:predicted phosphodiesterase